MTRCRGRVALPFLLLTALGAASVATSTWAASQRIQFRSQMSVEEFGRCGLAKLSAVELVALESWVNQRLSQPAPAPGANGSTAPRPAVGAGDPVVSFNVSSHKYHCPSCRHAIACTKNCIDVRKSEALRRGGVACGTCGGTCR